MSRVFFVSANLATDPYPVYPLGMAVVAATLVSAGHEVSQFDFLAAAGSEACLRKAVDQAAPDYVCLSIRNIDSVDSFAEDDDGQFLQHARRVVEVVREVVDVPIIAGGPAVSIMPEKIVEYTAADHGIVGGGEHAVCDLLAGLEAGEKMPRIFSAPGPASSELEFPSPLLDHDLVRFYLERTGILSLQTKRGCPYNCTYCTYPELEGRACRSREPEAVITDLERMHRDYGAESFFFADSVFNDVGGIYLELVDELARRQLPLRWSAFFSPKGLSRDALARCKRSGLYAVELGTDAAHDTTLAGIEKSFSFDEVVAANDACVSEEIPCAHFVMFGGPGETPDTVARGLENLAKLDSCVVFAFSGIRIFPGTGLFRRALTDQVITEDTSLFKPAYYVSPEVDQQWMNETIEHAWRGRRDRIFPPSQGREKMSAMLSLGYKGILWDQLLPFGRGRRRTRKATG